MPQCFPVPSLVPNESSRSFLSVFSLCSYSHINCIHSSFTSVRYCILVRRLEGHGPLELNSGVWPFFYTRHVSRRFQYDLSEKAQRGQIHRFLEKQERWFKDVVIVTAAASISASTEVAIELLRSYISVTRNVLPPCFMPAFGPVLKPDIIGELRDQYSSNDFYLPYHIQVQRSTADKVC